MRGLNVVYVWLGQTSVDGNTTSLERVRVPSVRLALVWLSFAVYIHTWKNADIFYMQKMCAEVDAHDEWITFINEFWRTPSESQRTDQNSSFFGALDVRDGMCDWVSRA